MPQWLQPIVERLLVLGPVDYFTLSLNLLVLAFSGQFATLYGKLKDRERSIVRLRLLRQINIALMVSYLVAVIFNFHLASAFSQTFLVILCTYLLMHFLEALILARYGRDVEVEGFARKVETYTSRTLEICTSGALLLVALVVLVNVWGFESWLKTTSVIGFLALVFFGTKDYWAGDFLSGIILIGDGRIERGDVIRIPEEDLIGIVLQIRSVQTVVRDLVRRHDITIPNSFLLRKRIDIYKTDLRSGVSENVSFKIGYGATTDTVQKYLHAVWEKAARASSSIDASQKCRIELLSNDDHAAVWRLSYTLKSPHGMLVARSTVNLIAYELQGEYSLTLSTPLTHTVNTPAAEFGL